MRRCCLCGDECIPMADYDAPVCIDCDSRNEAAWLALLANTPRRGRHHRRSQKWQLPEWAAKLPLSSRTGPADPAEIAQLLKEMDRRKADDSARSA